MDYEQRYMDIANRGCYRTLLQFILVLLLGVLLLGVGVWFALRAGSG